jgi:YQGE family putative transporter
VEKEARLYLVMMAFFTFAFGLSNMFISVFIWKLNSSFTLLAIYSLVFSIVILASFPLCAVFARKTTPMASLRLGIVLFIVTFGLVLFYKENTVQHIYEIGFFMGLGASFFAIGMHMQTLDSTKDGGRDRFLYLGNLLNSIGGMIAPLLAGFLIERYIGMKGYYLVFSITLVWFILASLISLQLKGKQVSRESHFLKVWRNPSREWRGMYWATMGAGVVEGTYGTFLVTMMTYSILQSELTLGGFATFAALVGLLTSLVLAKVSKPQLRFKIYTVGALFLSVSSFLISIQPEFTFLVIYTVVSTVGMNLISTTFNAWTYASIEKDPDYENRRLDYIVIREIPLGFGRIVGVLFFLLLQAYFDETKILPVSFAVFGSVYVLMTPFLKKIWMERDGAKRDQPFQQYNA